MRITNLVTSEVRQAEKVEVRTGGANDTSSASSLPVGVKYDSNKLRYDLFPASLDEVALVYTEGAKKYSDRNWEKGMSWGRIFGAMIRHAWAWWWGRQRHERRMHHLGSVAWCALALMEYERTHPELDDRPAARGGA